MRPVTINTTNVQAALEELMRASHEADTTEIAQNISFDNAGFTQTLQLLVNSPTLANTNLVLATLILMLQKGGPNRST